MSGIQSELHDPSCQSELHDVSRAPPLLETLTAQLADSLVARGLRLAVAESCTGGWVAKTLTDRPGSSRWFECGFVTYGNAAKERLLGVKAETLARAGAVSAATVAEMAMGALTRGGAEVALSISGIAGPGGGTPDKPVGTVWCAWVWPDPGVPAPDLPEAPEASGSGLRVETARFHWSGDREQVRRQAVRAALAGLLARLSRQA